METNVTNPQHPIQVVARRTGLSADVIRAWERRYQAVTPERAANSRRLYSDLDVEKLGLLRRATSAGRRIGDIANQTIDELYILVENDESAAAKARNIPSERPNTGSVMEHFEECLDAINHMQPSALQASLVKAANTLGIPFLLEDLLRPLIAYIRDECRRGNMRLSQERMATAMVRSYMCTLTASKHEHDSNYNLVVTTPMGQEYDLIALRMAVAANSYGWNSIYLGTELPADEIVYACTQTRASAVALGIARPADDPHLPNVLRQIKASLSGKTTLIVCGNAVSGYTEVIEEVNAIVVQTMGELRLELDRLKRPISAFLENE
jgi:DNA-binding transcriptional MerR regulator/methylmalonyl-CoA mutase cobalamin-binding subunit